MEDIKVGPDGPTETEKKPVVFIGIPTYDEKIPAWCVPPIMELSKKHRIHYAATGFSLLAFCFNQLWTMAMRAGDVDYFIMIHSDVTPEPDGLTKLVQEIKDTGADVVSAFSPIKDARGITSTGLGEPGDPWGLVKRFTMAEIMALPETIHSTDYPDKVLAVNTGLMVVDFKRPWVKDVCFSIQDRMIPGKDGFPSPRVIPEDWGFSRWLWAQGAKVCATRKITLHHKGSYDFPNNQEWGTQKTDEDWEKEKAKE